MIFACTNQWKLYSQHLAHVLKVIKPYYTMTTSSLKLMKAFLMTLFWVMGCSAFLFSQPVITVHFANPQYNCNTNAYCVDVEFQSNTANQEIFEMNVRFFYDDSALELIGFSGFVSNYSAVVPNPPNNSQSTLLWTELFYLSGGCRLYQ